MDVHFSQNFDELLKSLKDEYEFEKRRAYFASEELRKLREEYNKDEEIKRLNDRITTLRQNSLHILSDKERDAISRFRQVHYESHKESHPRIAGSSFIYRLSGTGIGTCVEITCPICNETLDVTDTSSW